MNLTEIVQVYADRLEFESDESRIIIQAWGSNSFRVRITPLKSESLCLDWALNIPQNKCRCLGGVEENGAFIRNGKIEVRITSSRVQDCNVSFYKIDESGEHLLLSEKDYIVYANNVPTRQFKFIGDNLYQTELHLEAYDNEKIFGMGENDLGKVNLKGSVIDLYQRHIKAPIPFILSSRGYGFLWNNPSLGRVEFSSERTRWVSYGSRSIDYYITTGDSYAEIFSHYTAAVGRAPKLPYWASGFWQCKLRYKTQEEFLSVAKEFKKRELPISALVIDYCHWDTIGNWRFDEVAWPDPKAMCDELKSMDIKVIVSPWTLVDPESVNYEYMKSHGLFTGSVDGCCDNVRFGESLCAQYDPTNPEAADYLWEKWKETYVDAGITSFWLDPCDEFHDVVDYDKVTFFIGKALECHAIFVIAHQKNIYDHLKAVGEEEIVNICRNAWVGSWRYGACPAPHDIECSFRHLKAYFKVGLNMMVSGTPWWNCDIGGFWTESNFNHTDEFYELMIRWYQWGVFMPIFRTHGNRINNEPWTIGGNTYPVIRAHILLREALRPYIMKQMNLASESGLPPVRPLFFDNPNDENAYLVEDELLFGDGILVAPVLDYQVKRRNVYLPTEADWINVYNRKTYIGGQTVECEAPVEYIPIFVKKGCSEEKELVEIFEEFFQKLPSYNTETL